MVNLHLLRRVSRQFISLFVLMMMFGASSRAHAQNGGQLPIAYSHVYLFAASTAGSGTSPISMLHGTGVTIDSAGNGYVTADSNGNWSLAGLFAGSCPSASSPIYVLISDGNSSFGNNPAIAEVAAFPVTCGNISSVPSIVVNELTTAAAAWALAPYANAANDSFSSSAANAQAMENAFVYANTLVSSYTGKVTTTAPYAKVNTLADMLAACINTNGSNPCPLLFSDAKPAQGAMPTDTLQAAIDIAQNPDNNVGELYELFESIGNVIYAPTLTAVPPDWSLLPAISWGTPAAIPSGTALSATQLNATALVPGSFVYTPAAGTVPAVGTQTLSVTFTPTDATAYAANTASVSLTVFQSGQAQTINFATLPSPVTYGIPPITLSATGGGSGNIVSFTVQSGPGSIFGNTLVVNGTGTILVAANQAGNATYAAAIQVAQTVVVNPASTGNQAANGPQTAFLKYKVMGVVYAPPGAASSVTYGNSTLVGSTDTLSFTKSTTHETNLTVNVTVGIPFFGATTSYSNTDGWTDSNVNGTSVAIQTQTGNSVATMGPISSSLGVDHDNDVIYLWLNPVLQGTATTMPTQSGTSTLLNWTGLETNSCDSRDPADLPNLQQTVNGCDPNQYPYQDIVGIPVWCLKNPFSPNQGCAQWIAYTSRSWDHSNWGRDSNTTLPLGPGLTMRDYADILEADPFVVLNGSSVNVCHPTYGPQLDPNVPETMTQAPLTPSGTEINFIDPLGPNDSPAYLYTPATCMTSNTSPTMYRFQPYGAIEYPVPGPNGLPSTYSGTFQYSRTNTTTNVATDSHTVTESVSVGVGGGGVVPYFSFGASVGTTNSDSTTWQQESGTANSTQLASTAAYSVTGPQLSDNYVGPATYNVYLDNIYGTYAFYSDIAPQVTLSDLGTIGISTQITRRGGQTITSQCSASNSDCYPFPGAVTAQTPAQWSQTGFGSGVHSFTLTNTSVYPMTMASPAVTFSDPGFQLVENDGSDTCSNRQLPSGQPCTLNIAFAPVPSDAPNLIGGSTYPVTANIIAAGTVNDDAPGAYQNILVTNYGIVSGTAAPGPEQTGATLLPATEDTSAPNAYIFPVSQLPIQTEQFIFTNYSSSVANPSKANVTFAAYPNDITLTDNTDFSVLNSAGSPDTCSGATVLSGGSCSFTLQFAPTTAITQAATYDTEIKAVAGGQTLAVAGASGTIPLGVTVTSDPSASGPIVMPLNSDIFSAIYIYDWAVPITITNTSNATFTFNQTLQPTIVSGNFSCEGDAGTGSNGYFTSCIGPTSQQSSSGDSFGPGDGYIYGQLSGYTTTSTDGNTAPNRAFPCDVGTNVCVPGLPPGTQTVSNPAPPGLVPLTCGLTLNPQSSCTAAVVAYIAPGTSGDTDHPWDRPDTTFTADYTLPLAGTFTIGGSTVPFTVNIPVVINGVNNH